MMQLETLLLERDKSIEQSPMPDVLQVEELHLEINTPQGTLRVLDGISLSVGSNEIVGLVGESGSGKTMTALSVLDILPNSARITNGIISLNGRNLLQLSEQEMEKVRGKEVSMVFQDPASYLNPLMRVGEQIAESFILNQGLTKRQAKEAAVEMLGQMRVPKPRILFDYYPFQLSGGQRQRVMIAIALAAKPSLIIADEPTSALDVIIQDQILELLEQVVADFETSLLLITHDLGVIGEICDRVYVMYLGQIMESAKINDLYDNARHPYTLGLYSSILTLDEYKETIPSIAGSVPSLSNRPRGCPFITRCSFAEELCNERPPMFQLNPDHISACWLHFDDEQA